MTKPASLTASAAVPNVEVPEERSTSRPLMRTDEKDGTVGDIVKIDQGKRVGMKQRLQNLQDSCCAKKRKVPASVSEAVYLAVKLIDDAAVALWPSGSNIVEPRTDELAEWLASIRVEVVSLLE